MITQKQEYGIKKMKSSENLGKTTHSSKQSSNNLQMKHQKESKQNIIEKNPYISANLLP